MLLQKSPVHFLSDWKNTRKLKKKKISTFLLFWLKTFCTVFTFRAFKMSYGLIEYYELKLKTVILNISIYSVNDNQHNLKLDPFSAVILLSFIYFAVSFHMPLLCSVCLCPECRVWSGSVVIYHAVGVIQCQCLWLHLLCINLYFGVSQGQLSLSACIRVSGCGARKDIVCLIVEMAITFLLLICVCATLRIPARDLISPGLQCVTVWFSSVC